MIDITKSDGYTVKVPLHILNTCNTDTRVHCKILLISEIWWQLPVFRCWCRDMILVSFDTLWSSVQSIQNPSSDSKHLQHGHPYSLFIAKFSNFWNMMATSIIQMLVSWYDSGIFWYTGVLCSLYRILLHILKTCNMNTRGRCKIF
jgi:hypothetical protein